jgi:hypothetical protein
MSRERERDKKISENIIKEEKHAHMNTIHYGPEKLEQDTHNYFFVEILLYKRVKIGGEYWNAK